MCQEEPLEKVMASVNFPVYGLTKEMFGLRLRGHLTFPDDRFITLDYQSERYIPFLYENLSKEATFSVRSYKDLGYPMSDIKSVNYVYWEESPDIPVQDTGRICVFSSSLTIDGEQFIGNFLYYPAPIFYSMYWFYHGQLHVNGQAHGPHPDELIQILQSLRVLNGKAVQ